MTPYAATRERLGSVLAAALLLLAAGPSRAQILPWEVTVAEIESGRLRNLAQRLNKQYLLYQLHLGEIRKTDLVATATQIDRVLESLERGSPAHSIPAPWTKELRDLLNRVDGLWGPLRRIAVASPYEHIRVTRQFMPPPQERRADPLLLDYFDNLSLNFVSESEKLLAAYHVECLKTGIGVCPTALSSGYAAMVIERATREAVCVVKGIDADLNRKSLKGTIQAYLDVRTANDENPFFAEALDPERGVSARAAGQLLLSLRDDWDAMQAEFRILAAGDEENFDLRALLTIQSRLVEKVERLTGALVRYASLTYGS
jgi:hypothetical protein